jgi:hypothetical protein
VFRLLRVSGETPEECRKHLLDHPVARNRSSAVGRSAEDMPTHSTCRTIGQRARVGATEPDVVAVSSPQSRPVTVKAGRPMR